MKIIPAQSFVTLPWKNGGGVTHEISKQVSVDGFDWRVSIAEVERDGSFSLFPGQQRCLTVIAGDGMKLERGNGDLAAELMIPVWFSGDDVIYGRLHQGACRDFNLIYDASKYAATVQVVRGDVEGKFGAINGVYLVEGHADEVAKGDFAFIEAGEKMRVSDDATMLSISLVALL